ncbi:MAG TPA: hypothetical protein VHN20_05295 [Beijerinckiaceae bacterium]|nr:hypothetical protein [Beijerinckiaceae bacterium]
MASRKSKRSSTNYSNTAKATGAAALIGALAGLFWLKRSGKTIGEVADDVSTRVKDGIADATQRAKDSGWIKDGVDEKSQAEIAEEALTLKETGAKSKGARGPLAQQDIKAGIATSNQEAKAGAKALS